MTKFRRAPKGLPKTQDISLDELRNELGEPVLKKQMLAKIQLANTNIVSLKDLATWLDSEDGDVTDVRRDSMFIFSEQESNLLMAVVLYHQSAQKEELPLTQHWMVGGDNPYTAESEAPTSIATPIPSGWKAGLVEALASFNPFKKKATP